MASLSHPFRTLQARWPILKRLNGGLVLGLLIAALCLGVFAATAEDVQENDFLVQLDHEIAVSLHQQGLQSPGAITAYKVISAVGLPGAWVMGLIVAVVFASRRQWLHLGVWSITLIGGILLNNVIKLIFARARPVFADPFVIEQNFSFPSGHAMITVIAYGLLAYLVLIPIHNRIVKIWVVFATVLLTILMGMSRIALGVHFFSDVIGGFAAGGAWLALCIILLNQLTRRQLTQDAEPKSSDI